MLIHSCLFSDPCTQRPLIVIIQSTIKFQMRAQCRSYHIPGNFCVTLFSQISWILLSRKIKFCKILPCLLCCPCGSFAKISQYMVCSCIEIIWKSLVNTLFLILPRPNVQFIILYTPYFILPRPNVQFIILYTPFIIFIHMLNNCFRLIKLIIQLKLIQSS